MGVATGFAILPGMTRRLRTLAAPLLLTLALTGCGGDDSPTTSPTAPDGAVTSADPAAEAAAAARINLTAADLGTGWTGTAPDAADPAAEAEERALYACVGGTATDDFGDDVSSQDFTDAAGMEISSAVDFYASEGDAKGDLALLATPKAEQCLRTSLEKVLRTEIGTSGGQFGAMSLERRPELETVPESLGFRFTVTATAGGQTLAITGDLVAVVRGRIGVSLTAFGLGGPFPADVLKKATAAVTARAEAEAKAG